MRIIRARLRLVKTVNHHVVKAGKNVTYHLKVTVSVSSQADTENADVVLERRELADHPVEELRELAGIYERRGLPSALASQVAEALTLSDPLAAHIRDELSLEDERRARPLQAAGSSALAFSCGAILPLLAAVIFGGSLQTVATVVVTLP